jgi:hypothetical protein
MWAAALEWKRQVTFTRSSWPPFVYPESLIVSLATIYDFMAIAVM